MGGFALSLALQIAQVTLVVGLAPLLIGWVRKVRARLLRRRGPPLLQPYRDLWRLVGKEAVIADHASWLFGAAPYVILAAIWAAAALTPTFAAGLPFGQAADLIVIAALLSSARFFQTLAALDAGGAFGGLGSSREVMIASMAEPALMMVVFTLSLLAHTTQLSTIAELMRVSNLGLRISLAMALIALLMVALAETGRIPIDNPSTHLELTMVHEAMVLEYSGRHLAVMELAGFVKLLMYLSLIAALFLPWGVAQPGAGPAAYLLGLGVYLGKLVYAGALLAGFEAAVAKMRVFRVPQFMGGALMLGFLATLLLFVSHGGVR